MESQSSFAALSGIFWFFKSLILAVVNLFTAVTSPEMWLDWTDKESLIRFVYYGASVELFFVFLLCFIIIVLAGLLRAFL